MGSRRQLSEYGHLTKNMENETKLLPKHAGVLQEVYEISDPLFVIKLNQLWREMLCNLRGIYFKSKHELPDGVYLDDEALCTPKGLFIFNQDTISKLIKYNWFYQERGF